MLEKELEVRSKSYASTPNYHKSMMSLVWSARILKLHEAFIAAATVALKEDARWKLEGIFFLKAINSAFALHILIRNYQYSSSYDRIRYLYESYMLLRGLNRNDRAMPIFEKMLKEVGAMTSAGMMPGIYRFTYVHELSKIIDEEKKRTQALDPAYARFYNSLSNMSAHPHRHDYAFKDGSYSQKADEDLTNLMISLLHGLMLEYFKCFRNLNRPELLDEAVSILDETAAALGDELPSFIEQKLPDD